MRAVRIEPGTRAIITGASRGIGRALAFELAARGALLGLIARGKEGLEQTIQALPSPAEGEHLALAADVGRRSQVERALERFTKRAGGLDLLVANAGIAHYAPLAEVETQQAEEMVKVNVLGVIYTVRAGLPPLLEGGSGHIVVTSSGAALRTFPGAAVYGGTKAFERGFAEALRHELSGTGVSLTTVYPGEVSTDLHAHERERMPDWYRASEAIAPAEAARAIVAAVESDRRAVYVPAMVRALALSALSPRLADEVLARIRGPSAAPRRD
jgi:short-subunit dehydrogenase